MEQFRKIFKKVGGWDVLRQYARAHVLFYALFMTLMCGFTKKSLEIVRIAVNNKIYKKLYRSNKRFIADYLKAAEKAEKTEKTDKIKDNKDVAADGDHPKIIWTAWLQGIENAPEIVKVCHESVKKNIKGYEIIVITEDNYSDYVTLPDFIIDKYKRGIIGRAHFADLIRVELMFARGGTWLDATVFVTKLHKRDAFYLDSDLFLFQRLKPGLDGHCRFISNWMITARKNHPIIALTRALMHNYWKNHDFAVDYFFMHYFFRMAAESYPEYWHRVVPVSNSMPHVILLRMFDEYDERIWKGVTNMVPFHKLSYKFSKEDAAKTGTYYRKIVDGLDLDSGGVS